MYAFNKKLGIYLGGYKMDDFVCVNEYDFTTEGFTTEYHPISDFLIGYDSMSDLSREYFKVGAELYLVDIIGNKEFEPKLITITAVYGENFKYSVDGIKYDRTMHFADAGFERPVNRKFFIEEDKAIGYARKMSEICGYI